MKKTLLIMFILLAGLTTLLLVAQEKETFNEEMASIVFLHPAEDEVWQWLIGDWSGWSKSPAGMTQDWIKFEWDLNQQFLVTHMKSEIVESNREMLQIMAKERNTTVDEMANLIFSAYVGKGYATIDRSGDISNYWFDSSRRIYEGTESHEGNVVRIRWREVGGSTVIERTFEKVAEDKLSGTFKNILANGRIIERRFEAKRLY